MRMTFPKGEGKRQRQGEYQRVVPLEATVPGQRQKITAVNYIIGLEASGAFEKFIERCRGHTTFRVYHLF